MSLLPAGRNLLICGVRKSQTGVNGRMQARRRTVNFWRRAKKNSHLLFSLYLPFVPFYRIQVYLGSDLLDWMSIQDLCWSLN